jgi:hypothetical protein
LWLLFQLLKHKMLAIFFALLAASISKQKMCNNYNSPHLPTTTTATTTTTTTSCYSCCGFPCCCCCCCLDTATLLLLLFQLLKHKMLASLLHCWLLQLLKHKMLVNLLHCWLLQLSKQKMLANLQPWLLKFHETRCWSTLSVLVKPLVVQKTLRPHCQL